MSTDRIARAMTCGRPRADFPARVMAPIDGRPRPGFTGRVMTGLEAAAAGRRASPGERRAVFVLVPAALALIAGVMIVRDSRGDLPPAPVAPPVATAPAFSPAMETPPQVAQTSRAAPAPRVAQAFRPADASVAPSPSPSIYMIAALEGPAEIAVKSIEPAAFTMPALDVLAPLNVPDLKGFKETPWSE